MRAYLFSKLQPYAFIGPSGCINLNHVTPCYWFSPWVQMIIFLSLDLGHWHFESVLFFIYSFLCIFISWVIAFEEFICDFNIIIACSVAWLIGWALILEYTVGGSAVARGISPNLVLCISFKVLTLYVICFPLSLIGYIVGSWFWIWCITS